MRHMCFVLTWILCSVLSSSPETRSVADDPVQKALTANQILEKMAWAYAKCKTYRDYGVVKTDFISSNSHFTTEKPFMTAFMRPDRFRFEYTTLRKNSPSQPYGPYIPEKRTDNERTRYIVWCNGKDVWTLWDLLNRIESQLTLDSALAGASGVSGGSAYTVPVLLFPEITAERLTSIANPQRIEDGKLENAECFRIVSKEANVVSTLWLDKKTLLLLRFDMQHKYDDDYRTESTTTYHPEFNAEVTDKMLEFNPPRAK